MVYLFTYFLEGPTSAFAYTNLFCFNTSKNEVLVFLTIMHLHIYLAILNREYTCIYLAILDREYTFLLEWVIEVRFILYYAIANLLSLSKSLLTLHVMSLMLDYLQLTQVY